MDRPHIPVLLHEFIQAFKDIELGVFVDGTVGAAGHASAILKEHPEIKRFIGLDQDPSALEIAKENLKSWEGKTNLVHKNFSKVDLVLQELDIKSIDGFFCDIGVSSMQLASEERGFSFAKEGDLDMRMDPTERLTAKEIVNKFSEKELGRIFREYGEERRWKRAAKAIAVSRRKKRLETTEDLKEALQEVFGKGRGRLNPYTLVFQALRIAVNDELGNLKKGLTKAIEALSVGGIIGVISFHSLEDRIAKVLFRENPLVEVITKKPIIASKEEIKINKRSRSAKMRFAKKIEIKE